MVYVLPCVILFLCFSVLLALRLPRLGKRELISAFRTFVRFGLVWFYLFPLPLGVWEGLQFVIVELPGFFSYLFLDIIVRSFFDTFSIYSHFSPSIYGQWIPILSTTPLTVLYRSF